MASAFPGDVNAFQVGSYFLKHYYQILQSHPELACQFYADVSTMVRVDCATTETITATGLSQINNIVMCLNLNGIEIKTANFLESWGGGILAVVSGLLQLKEYNARRRFVQTFFLAPQDKGYFVLNDIFKFLGDEYDHPCQVDNYTHSHTEYKAYMSTSDTMPETVPEYVAGEDIEAKEIMAPSHIEEGDTVDNYENHEVQQQDPLGYENMINESSLEEPAPSFPSSTNTKQDSPPAPPLPPSPPVPEEEPMGELPRQTYASVLRTKGNTGHQVTHSIPSNKAAMGTADLQHVEQLTQQQVQHVPVPEKSNLDTFQDVSAPEDEVFDLEKAFQTFGRIKPDGVAIRSRKEAGVFYGFVEFEDMAGIQNSLRASPIELNGRLIHVEERRPNSGFSRGGRRGRGRTGYSSDFSRGQFGGRSFGRGGQDHDRDYYTARSRGNGYQRRGGRQYEGYD